MLSLNVCVCVRCVQLFQSYDRDGSGTLDLAELIKLCQQEIPGLSYSDASFIRVRACGFVVFQAPVLNA